ncbi:biotin holocarboxylase synthetase [Entomophthora muscae]|uniref:Biotin holocarboxylase synthetase n=1 Tax=Entomophthora muscae TaxID=34485 RepID=A0ACC2UBV9_9FUNG|nr:biotin holocarboxylase synthetase [Entomophthora muscae]
MFDNTTLGFFPGSYQFAHPSEGIMENGKLSSISFRFPFLPASNMPPINCPDFYDGGGAFIDAEACSNTMVLATFEVNKVPSKSAAVLCQVGCNGGKALLSFVHPEHVLNPKFSNGSKQSYTEVVELVFSRWAQHLGLQLNSDSYTQPRITLISLSHIEKSSVIPLSNKTKTSLKQVYHDLLHASSSHSGLLEDKARFHIKWYSDEEQVRFDIPQQDSINNLTIVGCPDPSKIQGVTFHPSQYLELLQEAYSKLHLARNNPNIPLFGMPILYSEVITSTQSILVENPKLRQHLSPGAVFVASRQIFAKGRGKNSWVSPLGCCQFSCYLEHPMLNASASPNLIQFLGCLAVVEALRLKPGYKNLAIHIKWPNDIYGIDYSSRETPVRKKLGGVLVSSFFDSGSLTLIMGIGINVTNKQPSICINDLVDQLNQQHDPALSLPYFSQEEVAALTLSRFYSLYTEFMAQEQGFCPFLDRYYSYWLHSQELVTLSDQGNMPARILGITPEFGLLHVVSVNPSTSEIDPTTCQYYELQPDGNSFDLMTGMISQRVT